VNLLLVLLVASVLALGVATPALAQTPPPASGQNAIPIRPGGPQRYGPGARSAMYRVPNPQLAPAPAAESSTGYDATLASILLAASVLGVVSYLVFTRLSRKPPKSS
jgi:hypothetical protein